jgi:hypothetical protein
MNQQLNELNVQIKTLLDQIPGTQEMQSVPEVSFLTVAGFLSEVGDQTWKSKTTCCSMFLGERIRCDSVCDWRSKGVL